MRILVAEDDNISRILLTRCLEQQGHQCLLATDGAEAWLLLQDNQFDVVVTDWMMPELDGIELVKRLRSAEQQHYTYVMLLTALSKKEDFVAGMEAGADDYLTKPLDRDALKAKLVAAQRIVSLHRRMAEQAAELERLNRVLYETGRVDKLTGISNRQRMEEDLASIHSRMERYGHSYCLALVDIDFFKKYNDTYGHGQGDVCLRSVAQCLRGQARTGDEVYRYGGEEFLIVFPEQTADRGAIAMERIRGAVEAMAIPHEGKGPGEVVTISGGVTVMESGQERTLQQVCDDADKALYQAKKQGRNRIVFFDMESDTGDGA